MKPQSFLERIGEVLASNHPIFRRSVLERLAKKAMPQASDKDRERYLGRFPDIGAEHACEELRKRGYILRDNWTWIPPDDRAPTEEELFWVGFLVREWDFGGLTEA